MYAVSEHPKHCPDLYIVHHISLLIRIARLSPPLNAYLLQTASPPCLLTCLPACPAACMHAYQNSTFAPALILILPTLASPCLPFIHLPGVMCQKKDVARFGYVATLPTCHSILRWKPPASTSSSRVHHPARYPMNPPMWQRQRHLYLDIHMT